ncbi:sucrose glucosyltransferase [Desulfosarcina variabilis str. Montpellier]|uniref:sugar phosphorylase n=1 Tax=Desulfosarcina variabilis TaxID=2300 RepID=UPI003AFA7F47
MISAESIQTLLRRIYGEKTGADACARIMPLVQKAAKRTRTGPAGFPQGQNVLITYGDTLQRQGQRPLATLHEFARTFLKDAVSVIHFLPFFPYSSDDGFSVMDFYRIDETLGDWNDVTRIGADFNLMFDFVINHFSAKGKWFANYLDGRPGFTDFAIETDPAVDLSMVTRPRSLPLLTPFTKTDGRNVHLWTTFSEDQIDFNYKSLDVLEQMIRVLLFYVEKGAQILRLDAIAYLWKEIGTTCIHLPQTHDMVHLFRAVLDRVAPDVILITETNVPHAENISYFGSGGDEAQMVYNFTLPPLLFYTFVKQDCRALSQWAAGLELPSPQAAFFNFTASHDGIGVRPLEGILPSIEIDALIDVVKAGGGAVSTKQNPDSSQSPYELNITYVDAILADTHSGNADPFIASQAIQYSLPGVPATYIHSLLGSRNWAEGVHQTGRARTINREKLDADQVINALHNPSSFRTRVFSAYLKLIRLWKQQPAFHPGASFRILDVDPGVFAIRREGGGQVLYALANVTPTRRPIDIGPLGIVPPFTDLVSGLRIGTTKWELAPYQYAWLCSGQ